MEDMIRAKRKNLTVILALVSLFYFILTILLPVTYVRRFSVLSPLPEKLVIECYVPGRAVQTVVANHLEKPEITYSPQGEGTLVRIETQTLDFLDVTEAAIQFVPEDKSELLTDDYGPKNDEAAYRILEYSGKSPISDVHDQLAGGSWGAAAGAGFSVLGIIIVLLKDAWITDRIREKNLKYGALAAQAANYQKQYVQGQVMPERRYWLERKLKRRMLLRNSMTDLEVLFISSAYLWPGILVKLWEFVLIAAALIIIAWIVTVISRSSLASEIRRIGLSAETAPDVWWCMYCVHEFDGRYGAIWSASDIDMALVMTCMGHIEESYEFAERIWNEFGWKLTEGERYFTYHAIQCMNCRLLGKAEEEKEYHWSAEKEWTRRPGNKAYRKLAEMLRNME